MKVDMTEQNGIDEAVGKDDLPEVEPSLLRTGVFRVLTGVFSLAMGWILWNSFSWGLLLLFFPVAFCFVPFTLMGYEAQWFFDAVGDRVGRVVNYGVPKGEHEVDSAESRYREKHVVHQGKDREA
jgi:cytochrome bd-type quinol oxidase subunit 1